MFEDKTYEYIMDEMLIDSPDGIDTSEGSLIYNACSRIAASAEEAYSDMEYIYACLYPDTADLEHLVLFGKQNGVPYNEATEAVFKIQSNIALPVGTVMVGDDYSYIVTGPWDEDQLMYEAECLDAGTAPNGMLSDLEPEEFLEGFEEAKIIELLIAGTDDEEEEVYRDRVLTFSEPKPFGGNRAYYLQEVGKLEGVGALKVRRREGAKIPLSFINASFEAPTQDEISNIQERVDPLQYSGEGVGIAAIGQQVEVTGVKELLIDVTMTLEYEKDYSYEDVKSYIGSAIDMYLLGLREAWKDTDTISVRSSMVENEVLQIEGIIDVTDTTVNENSVKVVLETDYVPVRGEIVCN